jgi:hypothetical protein
MKERGMAMSVLSTFWGSWRYEYRMQIRRPILWLVFLGVAFLQERDMANSLQVAAQMAVHVTTFQIAAFMTLITNWLPPLAVGILVADRLVRDRRTKVEELLCTLPGALEARLTGKYLGTLLATLTPHVLFSLLTIGMVSWTQGSSGLFLYALLCYLIIVLPGMVFVTAFSLACPVVIWTPLYMFLFFGYWFWGNILSPGYGLPTLSGTVLTPVGNYIGASFFHIPNFGGIHQASIVGGVTSIVLLVGMPVLVLWALALFLRFEQARQ